jgi:hypothetical protein
MNGSDVVVGYFSFTYFNISFNLVSLILSILNYDIILEVFSIGEDVLDFILSSTCLRKLISLL